MPYDLFLWLKPSLTSDETKAETKGLQDFLSSKGRVELRLLGKKKLSYKIKGFYEGQEIQGKVDCPAEAVQEFKTMMNRRDSVLRYLLTKAVE